MSLLNKIIVSSLLIITCSATLASSVSDCIHGVKITKLTKTKISFKVESTKSVFGSAPCYLKKSKNVTVNRDKTKLFGVKLQKKNHYTLRATKYEGRGHNGVIVVGERYHFSKR